MSSFPKGWAVVIGWKSWETPPDWFAELNNTFHFTIDMASDHRNHLLPRYATPWGTFFEEPPITPGIGYPQIQPSTSRKVNDSSGLDPANWVGERVFCNPPYDDTIYDWLEIASRRKANIAVLLLPPNVDTQWFQDFIWKHNYDLPSWVSRFKCSDVIFPPGRIKFWRPPNLNLDEKDYEPNYSLPSIVGPAPRAGNLLAIWGK